MSKKTKTSVFFCLKTSELSPPHFKGYCSSMCSTVLLVWPKKIIKKIIKIINLYTYKLFIYLFKKKFKLFFFFPITCFAIQHQFWTQQPLGMQRIRIISISFLLWIKLVFCFYWPLKLGSSQSNVATNQVAPCSLHGCALSAKNQTGESSEGGVGNFPYFDSNMVKYLFIVFFKSNLNLGVSTIITWLYTSMGAGTFKAPPNWTNPKFCNQVETKIGNWVIT
jgi:hypothetical protein